MQGVREEFDRHRMLGDSFLYRSGRSLDAGPVEMYVRLP
jgi:hypothetical protein